MTIINHITFKNPVSHCLPLPPFISSQTSGDSIMPSEISVEGQR